MAVMLECQIVSGAVETTLRSLVTTNLSFLYLPQHSSSEGTGTFFP